jgi:histone acetyltransferase 1
VVADPVPVRAPEDEAALLGEDMQVVAPFHPTFTYPIFGEHEKIFGYKGLDIQVS